MKWDAFSGEMRTAEEAAVSIGDEGLGAGQLSRSEATRLCVAAHFLQKLDTESLFESQRQKKGSEIYPGRTRKREARYESRQRNPPTSLMQG